MSGTLRDTTAVDFNDPIDREHATRIGRAWIELRRGAWTSGLRAYVYGTGPSVDPEGLMDTIWEEADRLGFPIETISSEYDCSQFEFALEYDDALAALDTLFLFRLMSKELLIKRGFLFSYMPKPLSTPVPIKVVRPNTGKMKDADA